MSGCGQQIPGQDLPSGGLFDLEGQNTRRSGGSIQNLGEMSAAHSEPDGQGGHGFREGVRMLGHGSSVVSHTIKSSGNDMDPNPFFNDPEFMTIWPQRSKFKEAVLSYRKAKGISPEQMADMLGIKPSHLHGLLYDKRVGPSKELIETASKILNLPLYELANDGSLEISGAEPNASDMERFMLRVMGADLTKLTETQKQSAFEAWRAIVRAYEQPK